MKFKNSINIDIETNTPGTGTSTNPSANAGGQNLIDKRISNMSRS